MQMELYLALQAPPAKLKKAILEELSKRPNDASLYIQYVTFLKVCLHVVVHDLDIIYNIIRRLPPPNCQFPYLSFKH